MFKMRSRLFLGTIVSICISLIFGAGCKDYEEGTYEPPALAYEGDSAGLKQTVIVPTLDSPIEKGKNAIWCGSFQLAWDQMIGDVIKEPIQLAQSQDIASRLNQNKMNVADLIPDSYYTAAGMVENGIVEKIHQDMAAKFPHVKVPDFAAGPKDLLAYAYLTAAVKFTTPYFDYKGTFTDGNNQNMARR
jgi:hypothetical protein